MRKKAGFVLFVDGKLTGDKPVNEATLFSIGREPQSLLVSHRENGIAVTIPELDLWAVLRVR